MTGPMRICASFILGVSAINVVLLTMALTKYIFG
mgnify:CR=1 FL=1